MSAYEVVYSVAGREVGETVEDDDLDGCNIDALVASGHLRPLDSDSDSDPDPDSRFNPGSDPDVQEQPNLPTQEHDEGLNQS